MKEDTKIAISIVTVLSFAELLGGLKMKICPNANYKKCSTFHVGRVCPDSEAKTLPKTNCDIPMPNVESPKLELIPAAEAYKKTQEALKETDLRLLEEINNKILKATEKGEFSITGLGTISFDVREKLESLGYEITTGFSLNESYYLIRWEQEEN